MLQFLQTGKMLYVLAGVCGLGIISKLVTSSLYKRLIKETGNMALTKNHNLRSLKQKTENMFLLSHGIRNVNAYIEKQLYGFRFMKMTLDSWDNLSVQAMIVCFLIGGLSAFGAYWYRCDSYYIVLYGTMGILAGLFLVLVDNSANISMKRQQLADSLVDYVENSPHFYKTVDKTMESFDVDNKGKSIAGIQKSRLRDLGRRNSKAMDEVAVSAAEHPDSGNNEVVGSDKRNRELNSESAGCAARVMSAGADAEDSGLDNRDSSETRTPGTSRSRQSGSKLAVLSRKKGHREPVIQKTVSGGSVRGAGSPGDYGSAGAGASAEASEDELARSIDYLKQSLEQIAASRDQLRCDVKSAKSMENRGLERAKKELRPEDLKLLSEILQEYLI